MDNVEQQQQEQQQIFEGFFGEPDLEADENLDWLMDVDLDNPELPIIANQENVLMPQPAAPEFVFPVPNVNAEFEGGQFLLPQEQEQQPPEGQGFFYDDLGGVITEYVERQPDEYYPVLDYQQWATGLDEEGIPIFAPRPY